MSKKTKRTVTLIVVALVCLISTCILAGLAYVRSRQVQEQVASSESGGPTKGDYDIFWKGDETLLSREDIVVFDVRYDDIDRDILIALAECVEEKIKKKGIQPIFLGAETDVKLRSELLLREEMDMYIGLCVGKDAENSLVFGTKCFYNDAYYVPEYNNVWISDRLLQNVVTEISGKALGMEVCGQRDLLVGLNVPATLLQIGYLTNTEEGALLKEKAYLEQISEGIVKTVEEYYEGK